MSDGGHHHEHEHGHHHEHHGAGGMLANLGAGDHGPIERIGLVLRNLARRGRGGRPHQCCGNYGEPGC